MALSDGKQGQGHFQDSTEVPLPRSTSSLDEEEQQLTCSNSLSDRVHRTAADVSVAVKESKIRKVTAAIDVYTEEMNFSRNTSTEEESSKLLYLEWCCFN
ncbi:hypothetical protein L1987_37275 [Smallanthus sonchifolius]|uniref:Uncharacterized protein n=1 Tax=Smallanthus sonchifolius TaxID=185202 RepID=A0ACB9HGC7_9ASTR|nr:hypothetical protein L1987_37275 [Smallanthus sonchifolius]